jgi:cysteine-rich repeat protein
VSDTRSCAITNGTGSQTYASSAWGTCTVVSCNSTYHSEGGACASDTRACQTLPANTTAGTESWNNSTNSYDSCVASACALTYHVESGVCVSDTRSCAIANGTGAQYWDISAYGACSLVSCNLGFHANGNVCDANVISCSATDASAATQTWDGSVYGTCTIGSCNAGFSLVNNACVGGCGNNITSGGETCDDGNTVTEECSYGQLSCTVCNASCQSVAGETDFCTDGTLDAGEFCDDGNSSNADACNDSCTCGTGYHAEGSSCANNVQNCTINNGTATETWNSVTSSYGLCTLTACNSGYHQNGNACDANVIACTSLPANASTGTQTWNASNLAYGSCVVSACSANYHLESGSCVSDTQSCTIANGTGFKIWSSANNDYGSCTRDSCNNGYHANLNACDADVISCTASNATAATRTWDGVSAYGLCTATACASTYHIEFGECFSDTQSCTIANGTGFKVWSSAINNYGNCTRASCNLGYHANGNACEADTIGYCANLTATTSAVLGDGAKTISGELYIANATNTAGAYAPSNIKFQYGSGATGTNASGWSNWVDATYDSENGSNDKYRASVAVPTSTGSFDYAFRASTNSGTTWTYCMTGNAFSTTYDTTKAGVFTTSGESIDWCNTQFPATLNSSVSTTANAIYGRVNLAGKTTQGTQYTGNGNPASQTGNIRMQFGYGADGSAPSGWATWTNAAFNSSTAGASDDEYQYDWTPPATVGRYDYLFRASGDGGATWTYCDTDGSTTGTGINAPGDNINGVNATWYTLTDADRWVSNQFPDTVTSLSTVATTMYGQLYVGNVTTAAGINNASGALVAQFGFGASGTAASTWTNWTTVTTGAQNGSNDEYAYAWTPGVAGTYSYTWRYSGNGGATWTYAGLGPTGGAKPATDTAGWGAATITPPPPARIRPTAARSSSQRSTVAVETTVHRIRTTSSSCTTVASAQSM